MLKIPHLNRAAQVLGAADNSCFKLETCFKLKSKSNPVLISESKILFPTLTP